MKKKNNNKVILLIAIFSLLFSSVSIIVTVSYIARNKEASEINLAETSEILFDSNNVNYDNSNGLSSTKVQGAIDELYQHATDYSGVIARLTSLESNQLSIDDIYPVGSIYIGVNNTNPGTIFGGTWVAFGSGKTLIGVDTNDTSFDTVEKIGGNKSINYTPEGTNTGGEVGDHVLTINEMPSHSHSFSNALWSNTSGWKYNTPNDVGYYYGQTFSTNKTGGDGAHNHPFTQPTFTGTEASLDTLDPYITVYMWKRTA